MNKEPIILITKPEKQLIEKDNLEIEINNYDNSHLYYKGFDLGTFKEIVNLRQENQSLKEELEWTISIVEYNRILTMKNKEIHQLKDNWNKLKEDLIKIRQLTFTKYNKNEWENCLSFNDDILPLFKKMKELEQGSGSNENN